ncbi:hypothetical protein [Streptomyces sp. S.PNR 29]|uniref:hypothetical protein n=1 Tax=Streptomyces sp. S.PNR 29 TaxID=2973805 RepID=UPI0025B020DE|nr:hypothetical protein [Streptomyces sp. S.PNR 29]MDN0193577.1 hypothetical protein [Streptomyces sp. S.PNR 29]
MSEEVNTQMNIWQPEPGETLLARAPITFATGAATRVRGMRWFRDTDRSDIQHELPGWPEGPSFTARSTGGVVAEKSLKGAATAVGVAVMAFLSSAGGNISTPSDDAGSDTPDDPADEVEDFPVIWAAPGTIARTLPWQLDPGRFDQKHHRTHAIVTDRRLVIVCLPFDKKQFEAIDDEVLWQCARTDIDGIELKDFKDGTDFKVIFVDGSWCRLSCKWRRKLTRYLVEPPELLSLESLSPAQRATVSNYAEKVQMPSSTSPIITRNSCGHYNVDILLPSRFTSAFGASETSLVMDSDGQEVDVEEYHPEDF